MSSGKTEITSKEVMDLERAIQFLSELTENLRSGEAVLSHGEETLVIRPAKTVKVKTSVKQKKDKTSLEVKLSWEPEAAPEPAEPQPEAAPEPAAGESKPRGRGGA
jgi:amphi-Trp domain-containing protein